MLHNKWWQKIEDFENLFLVSVNIWEITVS